MSKRQALRLMSAVAAAMVAVAGVQLGAQAKAPDSGSTHTGVTVRGYWKIDVRNPDGTLASHTEFQNALTPSGQTLLTGLLSGEYVLGQWSIGLDGANGNNLCRFLTSPAGSSCGIVDTSREASLTPEGREFVFANLERVVPRNNGLPAGTLGLAGFAKVTRNTPGLALSGVWTQAVVCDNTKTAAQCQAGASFLSILQFTGHTLTEPIPVTFGQIVQVSVDISFSAAS